MKDLTYAQILEANARTFGGEESSYSISVLSNIVTHQLNDILEYSLKEKKVRATVKSGNYDNIVQDSGQTVGEQAVVIFWELANLIDGFQYKADLMEEPKIEELLSRVKGEIDLALKNLEQVPLVVFNKFSSMIFTSRCIRSTKLDWMCHQLNRHLEEKSVKNLVLVDIGKVLATVSIGKATDMRFFYSSKSLYSVEFYKEYCEFIRPIFLSVAGRAKKVLVLDCDNTLWKGTIGEEGIEGLAMSAISPEGGVFEEVQALAKGLSKKGVLLGLCSKNNLTDVLPVLEKHRSMVLTGSDVVVKKINWEDKATNLRSMAAELNVGLDSFVFVDDSSFEVNWVGQQLPEVTVLQVPNRLYKYPQKMREIAALFFNVSESEDDERRVAMYQEETVREQAKAGFSNMQGYLKSLELKLTIFTDDQGQIPRIAQLTQKTNQFNLTTKRYTEADIGRFVDMDHAHVVSFKLEDKFGDYGLTGAAILEINPEKQRVVIDSFLMSCRVIGRDLEFIFADEIIRYVQTLKVANVEASYCGTPKNSQVRNFYDAVGFHVMEQTELEKHYTVEVAQHKFQAIDYIEVIYG